MVTETAPAVDAAGASAAAAGRDASEHRVALPERAGLAAARALHARLLGLVDRPAVVLEAGSVERMSTAAVLVVVSFLEARPHLSPPAIVDGASGAFVDAFSELGLFASLMRMEFRG